MTHSFAPTPSLFLPISDELIKPLADGGSLDDFLEVASSPEQASLMLLLKLGDLARQRASVDKIQILFANVLKVALDEGLFAFSGVLHARFNRSALIDGLKHLEMLGVSLIEDHEVDAQEYLNKEGQWDFEFSVRYAKAHRTLTREVTLASGARLKMTDQQSRVFEEFKLFRDESFHLQAYAGAGKTYLLARFVELLNPPTTLLMAMFPQQVTALQARIKQVNQQESPKACTFGYMANLILNRNLTSHGWRIIDNDRARQDYRVSDSDIARWLNLQAVGNLQPHQVADACRRAVNSYCLSSLPTIQVRHLPKLGSSFTKSETAALLEYSRLMWHELVYPSSRQIRLPIRNVHRIKHLSLTSEVIPDEYTHIIIDESHELSAPILQILDRSPQAVVTLGDEYQQLTGKNHNHGAGIRQRYATQSIRAGKNMGEVINPLISLHPSSIKESFEGRAQHPTQIIECASMPIPDKPTTILVANEWGLFTWFLRLSAAGARFRLPESTLRDLTAFVRGLDLLYREDIRPRHRMVFRYGTWDALASAMGASYDFKGLHQWLDKGNTYEDFNIKAESCSGDPGAPILLAKVEDVKNQEFDSVMLSRDLLRPPREGSSHSLANVCSLLYTASSRARHELLVPGDLKGFVQDLGQQRKTK